MNEQTLKLQAIIDDAENLNPTDAPGVYLPDCEAIRAACLEIQAGWSSYDYRNRRTRWTVPVVRRTRRVA